MSIFYCVFMIVFPYVTETCPGPQAYEADSSAHTSDTINSQSRQEVITPTSD